MRYADAPPLPLVPLMLPRGALALAFLRLTPEALLGLSVARFLSAPRVLDPLPLAGFPEVRLVAGDLVPALGDAPPTLPLWTGVHADLAHRAPIRAVLDHLAATAREHAAHLRGVMEDAEVLRHPGAPQPRRRPA